MRETSKIGGEAVVEADLGARLVPDAVGGRCAPSPSAVTGSAGARAPAPGRCRGSSGPAPPRRRGCASDGGPWRTASSRSGCSGMSSRPMAWNTTRSWWPQATTRPASAAAATHPSASASDGGHGLFDIDRLAGRQRRQRLLGVERGGRGHGDHVHGVQERLQVGEGPAAQRHGQRPAARSGWGSKTADSITPGRPRVLGARGSRRTRRRRSRRLAEISAMAALRIQSAPNTSWRPRRHQRAAGLNSCLNAARRPEEERP